MKPVALITGGSRGIGLGIAKSMLNAGYRVAINGVRPKDQVKEVLEEINTPPIPLSLDLWGVLH